MLLTTVRCGNRTAAVCDREIEIVAEPQDITVSVGATAQFACSYTGTAIAPLWVIGNEVFTVDQLPDRHSYSNKVLTVSNVQESDSGETYRCSFIKPESRMATLTVSHQGKDNIYNQHILCNLL